MKATFFDSSFAACAAVVCLVSGGVATAQDAEPARFTDAVQKHFGSFVDSGAVPGIGIGVYRDGAVVYHALGVRSAGGEDVIDERTLFEIGSITKTFTGTLLAEAQRRGELSIDDPLSVHLPDGVRAPSKEGVEMTLAMLSNHTSGLPRIPSNMTAESLDDPYADYDDAKLWSFISGFEPSIVPGSGEGDYSNLAVGLLGTLLSRGAGVGFEQLVADRITGPLGMADTVMTRSDEQRGRSAGPHHSGGEESTNWSFASLAGAGALWSTTADMMRYAKAQIEPTGTPLDASLALAHTPRAKMAGGTASVGLGWLIAGDGSTLVHDGGTNGYRSAIYASPVLGTAIVVLANADEDRVAAASQLLFQEIVGMVVDPIVIAKPVVVDAAALDRLIGTYRSPMFGDYVVTRDGNKLMTTLGPQPTFEVFAESATSFKYRVVEARIAFDLPEEGKATAVTLFQNGMELRAERVSD